jgi:hypothetical protein
VSASHRDRSTSYGPQVLALAGRYAETGTFTLILGAATANIAMHAIPAHADEREARVREVERYGQTFRRLLRSSKPPGHRRAGIASSRPPARRRTRLPPGNRTRHHFQTAGAHLGDPLS